MKTILLWLTLAASASALDFVVGPLTNKELRAAPLAVTVPGSGLTVTGPLTNAQLRAVPLPVTGTVGAAFAGSLPPGTNALGSVTIGGTVTIANFPATQPVSGTVALGAGAAVIGHVIIDSMPAGSAALTDTELRATPLPVSGPLTDAQIRASALPVSGSVSVSNLPATQVISGTVSVGNFPATQPISGTVSAAQSGAWTFSNTSFAATQSGAWSVGLDAAALAALETISIANFPATQPVSGTVTVGNATLAVTQSGTWNIGTITTLPALPAGANAIGSVTVNAAAAASSNPIGSVSLGNSLGKTNVLRTGTLVTTATTADQVILTYTVTAGKTLYVLAYDMSFGLTTAAATAIAGNLSVESPSGTKIDTNRMSTAGTLAYVAQQFSEPIPIPAGTVFRFVCTPGAATSTTWAASFTGYEK